MTENKGKYVDRFKKFKASDWIVASFMLLILVAGLYLSIAFSVKLSQGFTLFGDSSKYTNSEVETSGPTSADIWVLVFYWVLSLLLLALWIYYVFFRKLEDKKPVRKTIENGRTVVITEEETKNNPKSKKKDDKNESK